MAESKIILPPEAQKYVQLFKRRLPLQIRLHETIRALGSTDNQVCLDVGAENPMMSYYLRRRGGGWFSAVTSESAATAALSVLNENVQLLQEKEFPFKKQSFDSVVILSGLEKVLADDDFIEQCHRVLKPDGRLIVNVAHIKAWSMVNTVRRVLGLTAEKKGWVRAGYTESELFQILKHGFDVHSMRTYSRFCVEFIDAVTQFILARGSTGPEEMERKMSRTYSIMNLFYKFAYQLDMPFFLSRGHVLIAAAKRRAWRPRNAPVLVDGRSISEAVLSRTPD